MTLPAMELETRPAPRRMTYEEFLTDFDSAHAEWVNGEPIEMSPVSREHQHILQFLQFIMQGWLANHPSGMLYTAPFQMKLAKVRAGREPDLIFIRQERAGLLRKNFLDGPADLAVEIISPESIQRDREVKFREYESCGVQEYWIIDPLQGTTDFYCLDEAGKYAAAQANEAGIYQSKVIEGFWVRPAWFAQDPPPPVLHILREMGII